MIKRIFWCIFSVAIVGFGLCLAAALGLPHEALIPIASAVLLLSAFFAYLLAKNIVKPLSRMDLENPEDSTSYREIRPLLQRLSRQNTLINRQMDDLRRQQKEFRAMTDNMAEGFILIDTSANILSYNSSAQRLMGSSPASGGLSGSGIFRESVYKALAGNHNERIVNLDGHVYQILANPVEVNGSVSGAVIVSLDITEKAERERMRHDFSSNVSHELKTPLTSIYGISEIMMNGLVKPDDMTSFAKNIHDESGRLITLINDIIKLSQLDDGSFTIEKSDVDLYALAGDVVAHLRPVAAEHGITISLSGSPAIISGISPILDEMIYNLCDNAIKYNVENGSVEVSVIANGDHPVITVSDTGIGIPREHIDRVFERFYRVDKSHSKEIGGTGLGLSIVKHGAAYHGAEVSIKSTPNKGTTVTVAF